MTFRTSIIVFLATKLVKEVSMSDIINVTRLDYKPGRFNVQTPRRLWKFTCDPKDVSKWVNAFVAYTEAEILIKTSKDNTIQQLRMENFDIDDFWDNLLEQIETNSNFVQNKFRFLNFFNPCLGVIF
jgi:hypothetical protein